MSAAPALTTSITEVTREDIVVRGHRLADLAGNMSFTDAFFLLMRGRNPTQNESALLAALMVNSIDHGVTQTVQVARLTLGTAPEAINAAIAAGLLGLGSKSDGAIEMTAHLLYEAVGEAEAQGRSYDEVAADIVAKHRDAKKFVPGLGHPKHKDGDPRTTRLFEIAKELGFDGNYIRMLKSISQAAANASGRNLPINGAAAVASLYCEMGFPPPIAKAITMVALTASMTAHLMEEIENPMARGIRTMITGSIQYTKK